VAQLVLASGSPRRRELLAHLGMPFTVVAPDVDETQHEGEAPTAYVARLAMEKADAVLARVADDEAVVIAADTCVDLAGEVLGKPTDADDARRMLGLLSGRTHRVHTGLAVRTASSSAHDVCTTLVTFSTLDASQIDAYVATGEPLDKAGAYALQGAGGMFVPCVRGSVSNVVGLPLHVLVRLLPADLPSALGNRTR
jgi:septum formation protein